MRFMAGAFRTRFRLSPRHAGLGPAISIRMALPRLDKRDGRDKPVRDKFRALVSSPTEAALALERRIVARVDRLRQKPFRIVGPELAHLRIDLDDGVFHLTVLLSDAADEDVADDVAVIVEADGAARRVGEFDRSHRFDELLR